MASTTSGNRKRIEKKSTEQEEANFVLTTNILNCYHQCVLDVASRRSPPRPARFRQNKHGLPTPIWLAEASSCRQNQA